MHDSLITAVLQRDGQLVELQRRLDTAVQEAQAAGCASSIR